jgi:hypothetical protein
MKKFNEFKLNDMGEENSIEISAWAIMQDGKDGSVSSQLVGTKEEAIEILGGLPGESFYVDGGLEEVTIKITKKSHDKEI